MMKNNTLIATRLLTSIRPISILAQGASIKSYLLPLLLGLGALLTAAEGHTWTNADGSKTFEGELQSYDAASGKVSVPLPSGKRMTFSQDKLSEGDIVWLKSGGDPANLYDSVNTVGRTGCRLDAAGLADRRSLDLERAVS